MIDGIATSSNAGRLLCEALGLDPRLVRSLTLSVQHGGVVEVSAEMITRVENVEALGRVLAEYQLAPRDDVAPSAAAISAA